ncbi:MAG: proton-conducting transporter membrane subunit [Planctomycetia bacterium]|jgi:NADH-quinone oxidoreductase subunit M
MSSLETLAFAAVATTVGAPLAAAGLLVVLGDRSAPRLIAGVAIGAVLAAGGLLAAAWFGGDGVALTLGDRLAGGSFVTIDGLTALLVPFIAVVDMAIVLAAPRRALEPRAVARMLLGVATTFATLATAHPAALVLLWIVSAVSTWSTVRGSLGGRPTARVYALAVGTAVVLMAVGTALLVADPPWERTHGTLGAVGGWLVALAVMIRKGLVPFHSWYPALYMGGPLAPALAATIPQVASYTAIRLLVGHAAGVGPELVFLATMALLTAAYGAALAMVQRDARGLVGHLAMSQSAMVLAGITATEPMELVGALAVWVSSGLSLTGIGLVVWALESRAGRLSIDVPQGRFADAPALAVFFLLFGLAGLGFPGTLSFVADDLIISGAVHAQIHAGVLVILATVFGGIAVIRGWFMLFGGPVTIDAPRHEILPRERFVFTVLLAILFGLGLCPGLFVRSLDTVAQALLAMPGSDAPHPSTGVQP